MPQVSVIIITYNRAHFLREAIDSVFSQTHGNYELIVVDDGSTDNTRDIADGYGAKIRYFYQENQGISSARNRGIKEARGEYIAFLDSDDIWFPRKLEKQVELILRTNADLVHTAREEVDLVRDCEPLLRPAVPTLTSEQYLQGDSHISMTVLVRREAIVQAGLFDEGLKTSNDRDMWLRIARKGKIAYLDEVLMRTRMHGDNISRKMGQKYAGRLAIARKVLGYKDKKMPRSKWMKKVVENSCLLGIEKYNQKDYWNSLKLIGHSFYRDIGAGRATVYAKDGLLLKIKKMLNPINLMIKSLIKGLVFKESR